MYMCPHIVFLIYLVIAAYDCYVFSSDSLLQLYISTFFINKIEVLRVNQEKRLVEFAGYITLAGNQQ